MFCLFNKVSPKKTSKVRFSLQSPVLRLFKTRQNSTKAVGTHRKPSELVKKFSKTPVRTCQKPSGHKNSFFVPKKLQTVPLAVIQTLQKIVRQKSSKLIESRRKLSKSGSSTNLRLHLQFSSKVVSRRYRSPSSKRFKRIIAKASSGRHFKLHASSKSVFRVSTY